MYTVVSTFKLKYIFVIETDYNTLPVSVLYISFLVEPRAPRVLRSKQYKLARTVQLVL